ncbi:MAG: GAF domain-containing sensor histidine kinase [Anaerolineae bacterium]|nr:GAF domain-containing sensor histidine kinase [Anaerolineae bacterium]MCB0204133.1 GAF domain-containing sensor histidine kinase [Anaerolineae bacterium]
MNPISAFFVRNIIAVFFFYGLAFFAMGLALLLASRRTSEFTFARAIIPLALFGILHGLHEWVEMYQKIATLSGGYVPTAAHEVLRLAMLVASFAMLAAFGFTLINRANRKWSRIWLPVAAMIGIWLVVVAAAALVTRATTGQIVAQADVLSRYTLGIPAAVLGAWALMTQQRTFREHQMPQFGRDLIWATTALLLYGVIGQIFVRKTELFPSTVINSELFLQWFGLPVQLFRGVIAAMLAVFMIRALNAFDIENERRLDAANQARLDAQANMLETERRISRERQRLNAELRQTARELGLLLELSNLLVRPLALQDRLDGVLQRLLHTMAFADAGLILLRAHNSGEIGVQAANGFTAPQDTQGTSHDSTRRDEAEALGRRCATLGSALCLHADGEILEVALQQAVEETPCQRHPSPIVVAAVPLVSRSQVIGSLVLAQPAGDQGRMSLEDIELLLAVAQQLGLSIDNARLTEDAQARERVLADLLHQVVEAQEAERQRIARELHDATGQALTAMALGLRGMETQLERGTPDNALLTSQVREIKGFSTHALGELRQIIADLRPPILDDMGLAAALKWYVQGFEGRRGVRGVFILDGEPLRLPSEFETVLFRIAQESLTNVAKHAAASTVTVMLRFAPGTVCLLVEDDGQGFDTHGSRFGGWGLLGMQERASLLGGQCVIDSTPKVGTRVWTTAPLPAPMLEMDNDTSETVVG